MSFLAALGASSADVRHDVDEWLAHRGGLPFGRCLERASYELRGVVYRDFTPKGEISVLRARDTLDWPPTIGRPRVSSGFRAGDRLLEVNGERMAYLSDPSWALRQTGLGDRLRFRVRRDGRVRVVVQRSPDLGAFAKPGLRYTAVIRDRLSQSASPLRPSPSEGAESEPEGERE